MVNQYTNPWAKEEIKEWIKQELIKFYKEHTSFDDYRDARDARELYSRLINALTLRGYDTTVARRIIIEVVDEIRREVEEEVKKARARFYKAVERRG